MSPLQSKMARVGLGWTTDDLAEAASVGRMTVARFERGDRVEPASVEKLREALERAGADFMRRKSKSGVLVPE